MMKDLGLAANDIGALQKMYWPSLIAPATQPSPRSTRRAQPSSAGLSGHPRAGWTPSVDAAPDVSKNVPILIGSVSEEGNSMTSIPTEEEWHAGLEDGS